MSKARKLQQEVETTLKKVAERNREWEIEWKKLETTEDALQRERIIDLLKKDLKKLQKVREQVRGWIASGEIKGQDDVLQEARRSIERHMVS